MVKIHGFSCFLVGDEKDMTRLAMNSPNFYTSLEYLIWDDRKDGAENVLCLRKTSQLKVILARLFLSTAVIDQSRNHSI